MNNSEVRRIVLGPLQTLLILFPLVPVGSEWEDTSNDPGAFQVDPMEPQCLPEVEGQEPLSNDYFCANSFL
jgi:hypothetical protein